MADDLRAWEFQSLQVARPSCLVTLKEQWIARRDESCEADMSRVYIPELSRNW